MTNGICQPNQTAWEEEQNTCRPEPIDCNPDDLYLEPTVVDAEVVDESSADSTDLPPRNETSGDSYQDAPTETLQSLAPKSDRPPFAVRIHQTKVREGRRDTVLTAHVGVEDARALESRPLYNVSVRERRGRDGVARVVAAVVIDHEAQESYALTRREVQGPSRRREVVPSEFLLADVEIPSPLMVARAVVAGPEAVRRLASPEVESEASPLVAGACALCGEHFDEPEVTGPVDPASANPEDNPNEQAATGVVTDSSSPATDAGIPSAPAVAPHTVTPAVPAVTTAATSPQNQNVQTPALEQGQPAVRPNSTMARSTPPQTVSIPDGYEGNGSGDSGPGCFGSVAVEGGVAYLIGATTPAASLGANRFAVRRGSNGNNTFVATTAPVTRDSSGRPIALTRALPLHESYGPGVETDDGAGVVTHLFPRVVVPVTIGTAHADATGVIAEFLRPGSLGAALSVVRSLRTAGDQPVVTRRPMSGGREADPTSPDLAARLAYNRAGAEEVLIDPSEVSFVSPQAAFLAHQASGMASRPVQVDSREQDGVVARQDAELNTVSDRTQMGTQTGGQDARQGTSDPTAVAMNDVNDEDVVEGELVDDDFEPYAPLGYADIVDVVA